MLIDAYTSAAKLPHAGTSKRGIKLIWGDLKFVSVCMLSLGDTSRVELLHIWQIHGSHMFFIPVQRWTQNSLENNICSTAVVKYVHV